MLALVVDDDPAIRLVASRALASAGMQTLSFPSADAALDHLSGGGEGVGLVLTDVSMPGVIDGLGLARHLRGHYPSLPVIVMSGTVETLTAAWAIPGVAAVIAKPFSPAHLAALARCATAGYPAKALE